MHSPLVSVPKMELGFMVIGQITLNAYPFSKIQM